MHQHSPSMSRAGTYSLSDGDTAPASASPPTAAAASSIGSWTLAHASGVSQRLAADNYYGQRDVHGRPHGRGLRLTPAGDVIGAACGEWRDGILQQQAQVWRGRLPNDAPLAERAKAASLLYPDGSFYVGDLSASRQAEGQGARYLVDGSELRGSWRAGQLDGPGARCVWAFGARYEGCMAAGKKHGLGVFTHSDGSIHEGEFADGKACGFGMKWDRTGRLVQCGRFADDQLVEEGPVPRSKIAQGTMLSEAAKRGALLYPNNCYYQGDLDSSFVPHGSGCMYRADGSEMMSGQWTRGRLQGMGRRIESGGDRYEGEFVDSKAQGLGRYSWPDGRVYEGEFHADKSAGLGVAWNAAGQVIACGRWADDHPLQPPCAVPRTKIPVGTFLSAHAKTASLLYPDGGYYIGSTNPQLQRHGLGSMYAAGGASFVTGVFRDDIQLTPAEVAMLAAGTLSPTGAR